jgi:tetratricopeptide (TPR) repeat protein
MHPHAGLIFPFRLAMDVRRPETSPSAPRAWTPPPARPSSQPELIEHPRTDPLAHRRFGDESAEDPFNRYLVWRAASQRPYASRSASQAALFYGVSRTRTTTYVPFPKIKSASSIKLHHPRVSTKPRRWSTEEKPEEEPPPTPAPKPWNAVRRAVRRGEVQDEVARKEKQDRAADAFHAAKSEAETAFRARDFADASEHLTRAIEILPTAALYQLRARAEMREDGVGKPDAALADAGRAVQLEPLSPASHLFHSRLLIQARKLAEASVALGEATRLGAAGPTYEGQVETLIGSLRRERGYANLSRHRARKTASMSLARSPWRVSGHPRLPPPTILDVPLTPTANTKNPTSMRPRQGCARLSLCLPADRLPIAFRSPSDRLLIAFRSPSDRLPIAF